MTEDWTLPMGMIDKWTLAHAGIVLLQVAATAGALVGKKQDAGASAPPAPATQVA